MGPVGPTGATGAAGPTGPTGPTGPAGADGVDGLANIPDAGNDHFVDLEILNNFSANRKIRFRATDTNFTDADDDMQLNVAGEVSIAGTNTGNATVGNSTFDLFTFNSANQVFNAVDPNANRLVWWNDSAPSGGRLQYLPLGPQLRFETGALQSGSPGAISGLKVSNSTVDTSNDITVAAGIACDDGGAINISLASAITKQLDAAWALGNNVGGRDTGSEASSTWYSVWLIRRPDTGVVDVLFSTSATSPTLPTNYTQKRRIGWVFNNASSILEPFDQVEDHFYLRTPAEDINVSASTTSTLVTVRCAPSAIALIAGRVQHASASRSIYISSPLSTDVAASATLLTAQTTATGTTSSWQHEVATNSSSQIRINANGAATTVVGITRGWIDQR